MLHIQISKYNKASLALTTIIRTYDMRHQFSQFTFNSVNSQAEEFILVFVSLVPYSTL